MNDCDTAVVTTTPANILIFPSISFLSCFLLIFFLFVSLSSFLIFSSLSLFLTLHIACVQKARKTGKLGELLALVISCQKQVPGFFRSMLSLLSSSLLFSPSLFPPFSLSLGPPPPAKAWSLSKWKKTFYNIKGRLFRKGRPCWGVEEACLLTLDTSYLRQLQMDVPLVIPTLCQVGLSRVTTLMWVGDH